MIRRSEKTEDDHRDEAGKSCLILSGGMPDFPENGIPVCDFVIACDRGLSYANELGIRPDLLIGDFDSVKVPDPLPDAVPVLLFPSDKDDTDTMLAVKEALSRGYRDFTVLAALGGRLDHLYANIECGTLAAGEGAVFRILSSREELYFLPPGTYVVPKKEGWSLSLFSLTERVSGLSVKGTKFEGASLTLTRGSTLGTSNAFREEEAGIAFPEGLLLVILSRLEPGEHN